MDHEHVKWHEDRAEGKPEIPRDTVQWVYISGYYDGPLSGMVIVKSPGGEFDSSVETLWAQVFEECDELDEDVTEDSEIDFLQRCGFYRKYLLYRLTPKSAAEQKRRHDLFVKYVGDHRHYVDGKRNYGSLRPQEEWHKFYDQEKTWPKWEPEGEVVGWFQI